MESLTYPETRRGDDRDIYHGTQVADPYRWLENGDDPERATWIRLQNVLTAEYLSRFPMRQQLRRRFEEMLRYPRYYELVRRGSYLFFKRNSGLQVQLCVYAQRGYDRAPDLLIDPVARAPDGTIRVTSIAPSEDGRYLAYGLSQNGSDWQRYMIKDVYCGGDLPEAIKWVKFSSIAWRGAGFYYSRYPAPSDRTAVLTARNECHQVWYHRIGTPQSADRLVYEDPAHPLRLFNVHTTDDGLFAVLCIRECTSRQGGNAVWMLETGTCETPPAPLVTSFEDEFRPVGSRDGRLLFLTNHGAPNWRLVAIEPSKPSEEYWQDILPEKDDVLDAVTVIDDKLLGVYRHHAVHRLLVYDQAGILDHEVPLPGLGIVQVFPGSGHSRDALWSFMSVVCPPTIYRYDFAARESEVFRRADVPFETHEYVLSRLSCPSRDGVSIPVFVAHRRGIRLDGSNRLLLYAYGGNGASVGLWFDPLLIALLEKDVVYAVAGVRGGGEYGEAWHRAGAREKKQNAFDDCIAVAEWLQVNGYTRRDRCAFNGASNGGLLVGAIMVQRPELFRVALPDVAVLDMLRFHRFTIGPAWTSEYGSSEDPVMFPTLLAYSPLHNIKDGIPYPATLATTSEHDDRVVPAHSFKFIAALQCKGAGGNPYLIRIESQSGHGPTALEKALDERADVYTFLLANLAPGAGSAGMGQGPVREADYS